MRCPLDRNSRTAPFTLVEGVASISAGAKREAKACTGIQAAVWRLRNLGCACRRYLALFAVLFLSSIFALGCKDRVYLVNYEPGPIQVLGSDGAVWLFVEIDRMVARPYRAYDAPSRIPIGHWQEVIILTETGEITRTKVQRHGNTDGVTFNMRNSSIFRWRSNNDV